ncbi:MAG TPA: GYD domain-containing protein [Ktedonobacterales bacterium]|jgi:uncharacterized protein with GYD domain
MATYVVVSNWTEQGVKNVKDTIQRMQQFRSNCEQRGIKVLSYYWTQGRYDNVVILEAPDETTVMATLLASALKGAVHTETLRAFSEAEMSAILQKV